MTLKDPWAPMELVLKCKYLHFDQLAFIFMNFLCQLYETFCEMKSHCLPVKSHNLAPGAYLIQTENFTVQILFFFKQGMTLPKKEL